MKSLKLILLVLIPVSLFTLSVDVDELKTADPVEFEDYHGPNKVVNTHAEITGIGRNLKIGLKGEKFTWANLYSIIHAVDPKSEKLNADIFMIEKGATVDTIFNVRRILSGYLQETFGYSYQEAFTLAKFITFYNGVYRSNMEYFNAKYSPVVLSHLLAPKTGIAKNYREWPGNTQIIIPLTENEGSVDTSNITDEKVIENLQKNVPDRGVADRKEIVEIKKNELKKEQKELQKKTEETRKIEKEIETKETKLAEKKSSIEKIENPEKKELAKKELEKEEKAVIKEKEKLVEKKEEIKQSEKTVQKKEAAIKQDEKVIKKDEKINELKKDPDKAVKELEKTEKELSQTKDELKKEKESVMHDKLYYLKVKEWLVEGHYDNDMVIIDPKTRKVLVRSPVKRIDCKKYLLNEKGVVVILHNDEKPAVHNLAILDKDNLTLVKKGPDNVFWRSFIEDREGFIYVIVSQEDNYYLGRFNYNLELEKVSNVKMDKDSFISFFEDSIFINRSDKNIIVLNKNDLSFVEEIQP